MFSFLCCVCCACDLCFVLNYGRVIGSYADRASPVEHRAELVHEEYATAIAKLDANFSPHIVDPRPPPHSASQRAPACGGAGLWAVQGRVQGRAHTTKGDCQRGGIQALAAGRSQASRLRQLSPDTSPHTAAAGAASPAWPRFASSWQGRDGPAGARRTLARARARRTSTLLPMLTLARPPTLTWEVARTVVAQPPIAAKWFGCVFRSCVRWCGGSCVVYAVRVTCVILFKL